MIYHISLYLARGILFLGTLLLGVNLIASIVINFFDLPTEYVFPHEDNNGQTMYKAGTINLPINFVVQLVTDSTISYNMKNGNHSGSWSYTFNSFNKNKLEDINKWVQENKKYITDSSSVSGKFLNENDLIAKGMSVIDIPKKLWFKGKPNSIVVKSLNNLEGTVEFEVKDKKERIFILLPQWVSSIVLFLIFLSLSILMNNLYFGYYFTKRNMKIMQRVGILFIVLFFMPTITNYLIYKTAITHFEYYGIGKDGILDYEPYTKYLKSIYFNVSVQPEFYYLIMGLLITIFATIFKHGVELNEEKELTI